MLFNNRVFAGVTGSEVIALDAETGKVVRRYSKADTSIIGLVVMSGLRGCAELKPVVTESVCFSFTRIELLCVSCETNAKIS